MTNGSHDSWLMAAAMAVATLLTALTVVAINVVFVHWLLSCSWIMASAVSLLVLAIAARPGGLWNRCWTNHLLRTFGKYAYALYLFHLPIRAAIRDIVFGPSSEKGAGPWILFPRVFQSEFPAQIIFYVVSIAAALVAAWISWHVFESKCLKLKRYFPSGIEKPCDTPGRT